MSHPYDRGCCHLNTKPKLAKYYPYLATPLATTGSVSLPTSTESTFTDLQTGSSSAKVVYLSVLDIASGVESHTLRGHNGVSISITLVQPRLAGFAPPLSSLSINIER